MAGMTNAKTVDRKMERLRWKRNGDDYVAQMEVTRSPFGGFEVYFSAKYGDKTTKMKIDGGFGLGKAEAEYPDLEAAKRALIEFFEELDEKRMRLPTDTYMRASAAYNRVISEALLRAEPTLRSNK